MKWVKRGLWLAAWGAWAWCGFGLHRELPRHEGAVLRRLPLVDGEYTLGFFADGKRLATIVEPDDNPKSRYLRTWDVAHGEVRCESAFPRPTEGQFHFNAAYGVIVDESLTDTGTQRPVRALDLESGRWTELAGHARFIQFHPERPWASLTIDNTTNLGASLIVADIRTGRRIFEWKPTPAKTLSGSVYGAALFVSDDSILIATYVNGSEQVVRPALEVWRVGESRSGPERVYDGVTLGDEPASSAAGFVAWTELFSEPIPARVLDAATGTVVATFPPDAKPPEEGVQYQFSGQVPHAMFSADGRTLFFDRILWDVRRRSAIWTPSKHEIPFENRKTRHLRVDEIWPILLGDWAQSYSTFSIRDFGTGRIIYRGWSDDAVIYDESQIDGTHGLCIDRDGFVRSYPPSVSYPLLAICQTILALPLVLMWFALCWRRKRRLRIEGTVP